MFRNDSLIRYGIYIIISSIILINLITIATFPSWFDEAFFANISFNLFQGYGFRMDLIPGYAENQVLVYGPIYFYLQAGLIHIFGLQELVFRLPNLITGYASILILAAVLRQAGVGKVYVLFFVIAVVLDVSFNRNLVYGRMDLLALFFVVIALYLAKKLPLNLVPGTICGWLLTGLLSSAAYLTTPRALFLLPAVFVIAFHRKFIDAEKPSATVSAAFSLITFSGFLLPILIWISHAGGLQEYIDMFRGSENIQAHISPSLFRSYYDNIAILIFIFLIIVQYKIVINRPLLIGFIASFLAFSLFVREAGPYAAMINPMILAGIVSLLSENKFGKPVKSLIIVLLLGPGSVLLMLRGADLIANTDCRDKGEIVDVINQHAKETIVIPFKYYFITENQNRHVVTLQRSRIENEIILQDADMIITGEMNSGQLNLQNFHQIHYSTCKPNRMPFLTDTFYRRSVFDELIFIRNH